MKQPTAPMENTVNKLLAFWKQGLRIGLDRGNLEFFVEGEENEHFDDVRYLINPESGLIHIFVGMDVPGALMDDEEKLIAAGTDTTGGRGYGPAEDHPEPAVFLKRIEDLHKAEMTNRIVETYKLTQLGQFIQTSTMYQNIEMNKAMFESQVKG